MLAEIGDCRERYPTKQALAADGRPNPSRGRVRQVQARPLPLGLRPPPAKRDRHPRRHQPPPQPLGRRHLHPRTSTRRQPPTRDTHPRPRLERHDLAPLARPHQLRPQPTHRTATTPRHQRLTQGVSSRPHLDGVAVAEAERLRRRAFVDCERNHLACIQVEQQGTRRHVGEGTGVDRCTELSMRLDLHL